MALETTTTNSQVVTREVLTQLEDEGQRLARRQSQLTQFAAMLAHPEFAEFFDKNFQTWEDCQTSIMLLKTGSALREMLQQEQRTEVTGHQILAALKRFIDHKETRQYMVQRLRAFVTGEDVSSGSFLTLQRP